MENLIRLPLGVFCLGLLFGVTLSQVNDPCDDPIDLSNPRRSIHNDNEEDNYICDHNRIVEGNWYTFETYTGGKMPETCQDFFACGTQAPIWMNGTHPEDNIIRNVTACVNLEACCDESYPISVKNCGNDTYVYRLANPTACDIAYCAGTKALCDPGTVWVEQNAACENGHPLMSGAPALRGPFAPVDHYEGTFHFACNITFNGSDSARFEVRWYFDGIELSCSVKSYWVDLYERASEEVNSDNSYWMGIQGPGLTVIPEERTDHVEIVFTSTVPITCGCCLQNTDGIPFKDKDKCKYQFKYNPLGGAKDVAADCYMIFEPGNQTASLFARAAERKGNIRNQHSEINFHRFNLIQNPIWNSYVVPTTLVQVTNHIRSGVCSSRTDPNIQTFDGEHYVIFEPGNFLLVNSSSSRIFEVHLHLRTCLRNPSVSCNCGVAVREGNVVIGVDNCQGHFRTFKKILVGTTQNHGTVTTNAAGTQFQIIMPSGAKVTATNNLFWHLNVNVYLPSEDFSKTEGLCGTWDKNRTNDFKKRGTDSFVSHIIYRPREFTDTQKLAPGDSFFDGRPECKKLLNQDEANYCKCESGTNIVCTPYQDSNIDHVYDDFCNNTNRKKRTADSFESIFGDLGIEEEYTEIGDLVWPTASGITEDQAKDKCIEFLEESAVNEFCDEVPNVNRTEFVAMCVVDIQVADNLTFGETIRDVFEEDCKIEAELNVVLGNDTDTEAAELAESISNNVCINHCSGQGSCVNAVCQCEADYLGADCSVHRGTPPSLTEVQNSGLCDIYQSTCPGIKVTANVIINGTVCSYREVEVAADGNINDLATTIQTDSTILSNTRTFCELPVAATAKVFRTYQLSISFDGTSYSNEELIYIYDSQCVQCSAGEACSLEPDTCGIAGTCYDDNTCTACEEAIDIGNPKRSSMYEFQSDDHYICDSYRIVQGNWYRFDQYTGNQIPEQCISTWHCGTHIPVWFNGTHPTAEAPVSTGLVCANYDDTSCCDWSAPVSVKFCTDSEGEPFYVYQLSPPPVCETAYCSGDGIPCEEGEAWDDDTETCVDIDECASSPCVNGNCTNEANHFTCTCDDGYTGATCEEEINLCSDDPCIQGTCYPEFNSYSCECKPGYTGSDCDMEIDECQSSPCGGNGDCIDGVNKYSCTCYRGYDGDKCDKGVWNSWTAWGDCLATCGYSHKEKTRTCKVDEDLCEGESMEYKICQIQACPTEPEEDKEEEGDSTEIEVSSDSIQEIIENGDGLKQAIAESINNYCLARIEECCEAMELLFSENTLNHLVTSSSVDIFIQGENEKTSDLRLAITIDIDEIKALAFCGSESDEDTLVLGNDVVAEAIIANSDEIEDNTGITITDVGRQQNEAVTEPDPEDEPKGSKLILIIALSVVGVIALIAVIALIIVCMNKKGKSTKRAQSSHTVNSATNLRGVDECRPTSPDSNLFLANQYTGAPPPYISAPPQHFNFEQMRPKTRESKNTALPPIVKG